MCKRTTYYLAIICLLIGAGCKSVHPVLETSTEIKDSTYVTESTAVQDTTLYSPSDSVATAFDCDSLYKASLKWGQTPFKVNSKSASLYFESAPGGRLAVRCVCDSAAIEAKLRHRITREVHTRTEKKNAVTPVKFIPDWVKWLAWVGGAAIVFFIARIAIKIYKLIAL